MKTFTAFCLTLAICQLGSASIIPGQTEKKTLSDDILQYNSELQTVSPIRSDASLLTSCNGVLNSTNGGIAYKAFEPIAANERCVWTIRGGGRAAGFSLSVLNLGSANNQDTQVIATCLRRGYATTHLLLNQTGPVTGANLCNAIVITFASGANVGSSTGFVLEYAASGNANISPRSTDYLVSAAEAGIIRHPSLESAYDHNEINVFTFLPVRGVSTNVLYLRGTLEGTTCYDTLTVLRFNASSSSPTKWENAGRICGNTPSSLISNDDLILIVFDSDHSYVGTGFQLAYVGANDSQCRQ